MSRYPLAMLHPVTGLQFAFNATDEQRMAVGGWTVDAPPVVAAVASVPPPDATNPAGASSTVVIKRKPGRPRKEA